MKYHIIVVPFSWHCSVQNWILCYHFLGIAPYFHCSQPNISQTDTINIDTSQRNADNLKICVHKCRRWEEITKKCCKSVEVSHTRVLNLCANQVQMFSENIQGYNSLIWTNFLIFVSLNQFSLFPIRDKYHFMYWDTDFIIHL